MRYEVIIATQKYYDVFEKELSSLSKDICHIRKDAIDVRSPVFHLEIRRNPLCFRGYRAVSVFVDEEMMEDHEMEQIILCQLAHNGHIYKLNDSTMRYVFGIFQE